MKNFLRLVLCVLMLALCLPAFAEDAPELLANGGFEQLAGDGSPVGWYHSAYRTQEGYTRFEITGERAHSGAYSAKIVNANENDSRYLCTVSVEPESMYRVSGYVYVDDMQNGGNGANFALEGIYSFSECVFDTAGEWQYIEWYGETDAGENSIQLGVRVGGYGAESVGTAYFDDLSVVKVTTLPSGVTADLWYTPESTAVSNDEETDVAKSTGWFIALAVLFVALFALLKDRFSERTLGVEEPAKRRLSLLVFALGLLAALLLRVALGLRVPGYSVDMNCFSAWSLRMASEGPAGFYAADYFCDYPPGYMLLLWPVGLLLRAVGYTDTGLSWLIVKSLPILADLAAAVVLYAFAQKRFSSRAALLGALLYAFNPAVLCNGAAWGQADAVLALLLLVTVLFAMERRWRAAIPVFVIAALVKPQALLFAPVGAAWLLTSILTAPAQERSAQWKHALIGACVAVGCAAAIIVPFSLRQTDPLWLVKRYQETLSSYPYATLNTANLCYLLGGNWSPLEGGSALPWLLPLLTAVGLLVAVALQNRLWRGLAPVRQQLSAAGTAPEIRRKLALSGLCLLTGLAFMVETFLPCTYLLYGTTWMIAAYLWGIADVVFGRDAKRLPFCLALTLIGIYVLGLKVHERYLFPALLMLAAAFATTRDRRLLWLCVGFSATTFINTAIVLDNSILFGASMGHLNPDTIILNDVLCVINLLLCGFAAYISFTGPRETPEKAPKAQKAPSAYQKELLHPRDSSLAMNAREWLVVAAVTVVYAAVAFTNLGSLKAPQSGWVATSPEEQVVLKLDQSATFKLAYYGGVSYNNFSISVSDDGVHWSESYPCDMREGICYRWSYALKSNTEEGRTTFLSNDPENVLWLTGEYIRINAESAGLNLYEVIARDASGSELPLTFVSASGAKDVLSESKPAQNLVDEQNTLEGEPGWFNGTYFDEIYHVRTAFEHLHGQAPYETTHPPLGKLLIAAGVAIFGMTPFGWRFAGALIGVLMLPAIYLLARQLTRKRELATFSMVLLALDLMHFTQTRIATIDSFPVFFILLSYLFMARYLMTDLYAVPADARASGKPRLFTREYLRTLVPLALSGLCMGLGIASKWIGLYSAVGLALLFFMGAYRQLRVGNVAYELEIGANSTFTEPQRARVAAARELSIRRVMVTCCFCVLFFLVVPAIIYYLSYIPYLSPTGPVTLARIIDAQEGMLSYHSTPGLGMDHPFQSPWWQWPFILKPMWYAQDKFEPVGYGSTIMCMGNPAVFYVGAVCMLLCLTLFVCKYLRIRRDGLILHHGDGDLRLPILCVGFLAQYLPWVLVPRSMYIYHYFASVPFIILATALTIDRVRKPKLRLGLMIAFCVVAAVFFALFYPYASGVLTRTEWLDWLKWFPRIYY